MNKGVSPGIRTVVLQRDKHVCLGCGSKRDLTVHHIIKSADIEHILDQEEKIKVRNDLDNFKTLCQPCHGYEHWKLEKIGPIRTKRRWYA